MSPHTAAHYLATAAAINNYANRGGNRYRHGVNRVYQVHSNQPAPAYKSNDFSDTVVLEFLRELFG
jgi:hypothetical protein